MEQTYLTIKELSEKYKISRSTINRWRLGGMPYIKIGNGVRFVEKDVLAWLANVKRV